MKHLLSQLNPIKARPGKPHIAAAENAKAKLRPWEGLAVVGHG